MDPDFVFIVNYACPRCHAALEARLSGAPSWLRCPSCGRASLPPEHNRMAPPPMVDDQTLVIGNFTTGAATASMPLPVRPRSTTPFPARQGTPTPTARVLLGSGLFLTVLLFLLSLLDSNGGRAGVFGFLAVVCLILLARKPGRPPRD